MAPAVVAFVFAMGLAAAPAPTLTILDWNIDRGYRLDQIAAEIRSHQTNIAILQEVDVNSRRTARADVAQELAHRLGLSYAFGQAYE